MHVQRSEDTSKTFHTSSLRISNFPERSSKTQDQTCFESRSPHEPIEATFIPKLQVNHSRLPLLAFTQYAIPYSGWGPDADDGTNAQGANTCLTFHGALPGFQTAQKVSCSSRLESPSRAKRIPGSWSVKSERKPFSDPALQSSSSFGVATTPLLRYSNIKLFPFRQMR